jgi:hypothetical protein
LLSIVGAESNACGSITASAFGKLFDGGFASSEQQADSAEGAALFGLQQEHCANPAVEIPASHIRSAPTAHHRSGALILTDRPGFILSMKSIRQT